MTRTMASTRAELVVVGTELHRASLSAQRWSIPVNTGGKSTVAVCFISSSYCSVNCEFARDSHSGATSSIGSVEQLIRRYC